jgi:hypothetical protein
MSKTITARYDSSLVRHVAKSLGMKMTHGQSADWLQAHEDEILRAINAAVYGPDGILELLLRRDA